MRIKPTVYQITEAEYYRLRDEDCGGICLSCGEIHDSGIEPDATHYQCENCGNMAVFGIEEALFMDRIIITPDKDAPERFETDYPD